MATYPFTEYFSSSKLSVTGGCWFEFNALCNSGNWLKVTIEWRNSSNGVISTSDTPTVHPGGTATVAGYAPDNAVHAVVTFAINHGQYQLSDFGPVPGKHYFTQTVPEYSIGIGPSSIDLEDGGPSYYFPPVPTGGPYPTSTNLTNRFTDDHGNSWTTPDGNFTVGQFAKGTAWPMTTGVRSLALLPGPANTSVGVTFRSGAPAGMTQGLVFRYSISGGKENYWRASRTQLQYVANGIWATVGTYSTPFADNDRMMVTLLGTAIKVYRNAPGTVPASPAVPVLSVTNSFNETASQFGIVVE